MKNNQFTLLSPHSPEACIERIDDALEKSILTQYGSKPLVGKVSPTALQVRKRIDYRNSFQTVYAAKMTPGPQGTQISGRMGLHPLVRKFCVFWIVGVILMGGPSFVLSLLDLFQGGPDQAGHSIMGYLVFPAMLICAVITFKAGTYFSKSEADFILATLARILDATIADPISPSASSGSASSTP